MKAAVLHDLGKLPVYQDFKDPVPQNDGQILIKVKAAALAIIDRSRASGKHYASYTQLPVVVGIDGVGQLENGKRVYAKGITGMMAEKALISKNSFIEIPDNLDFIKAAALPISAMGSALALLARGKMEKGKTVLINGATGVTGQLAVQLAKYYGASGIIATGRNPELLEKLKTLGADSTLSLNQDDESIVNKLKEIHSITPVDIVIDYLWGHPVELIIKAVKSPGGLNAYTPKVLIVSVGGMAGDNINLSSGTLRGSDIEILGSGFGSLSKEDFAKLDQEIIPETFRLAAEGKLKIEVSAEDLENIEKAWEKGIEAGKRQVIRIG